MSEVLRKRIKEATYLSAEKSWSYRSILRYCYIQHERMRQFLFAEEIHEHLQRDDFFAEYTLEELQQDLSALVSWGNLSTQQETGKVNTVEEFKKKRFRYQCTPYTVEFERMMMQLEQAGDQFGGSLERTQFERLHQVIRHIHDSVYAEEKREKDEECAQLWDDVMMYLRQITQNTSDYFAYIDGAHAHERMQTDAFLLYKDQFTTYLRDFIISLQRTVLQIQDLLGQLSKRKIHPFLEQVIRHKNQTFRFEEGEVETREEYQEKWANLLSWFLGTARQQSEFEKLQERTNETIRRVTRTVQRLGERNQHFHSRRRDYLHLAEWFDGLGNLKEAHELSSVVFGTFHTKHLLAAPAFSEDIYSDVWESPATEHLTKPRTRDYGEKTRANAIEDQQELKEKRKREHLEQKQQEKQMIERYMKENEITLSTLSYVEAPVRKLLLVWLSKSMLAENRQVRTEFGRDVKVTIDQGTKVTVKSDDGEMELPDVTFEFLDQGVSA